MVFLISDKMEFKLKKHKTVAREIIYEDIRVVKIVNFYSAFSQAWF